MQARKKNVENDYALRFTKRSSEWIRAYILSWRWIKREKYAFQITLNNQKGIKVHEKIFLGYENRVSRNPIYPL